MLSAVSHDLKTPLATIIGSLEIYNRMEKKLTKEKRDMLINSALIESYRLDGFITNILDMAKLENGMVNVRRESCDLGNLINDCITRLGPRRDRCEISYAMETDGQMLLDPMLFSRAVGLVLDNAAKHGGKSPVIQVESGVDGERLVVNIRDHGPGLPEGKEDEIFSKYTRFAKEDQQNAGTGLGLAICRHLMTVQGGSVHGKNHTTGGAQFTLSLPAESAVGNR
jgi:two-component system sensor histidine kinase KdpD